MTSSQLPLIFDGHNDTLLALYEADSGEGRSFFSRSQQGHLDLPRAREGGFGGGLFAMFVPSIRPKDGQTSSKKVKKKNRKDYLKPVSSDHAQAYVGGMMELLFRLEEESAGQLEVVKHADRLEACLKEDRVAAVAHIEGAEAIDPGLENLPVYYEAGLRSIGITWSRSNDFGHGVPFQFPSLPDTGPGLTTAGKALVRACNRLGILIDLSHLNERGFWDVAALSSAPLVASHSGVHQLCPTTRNLTDEQLEAIGESGGLVGINFHVGFLRSDGKSDPNTPIETIVEHIEYVANRAGIESVALGSDFDGATMPAALGDAAGLPKILAALQDRGYDDEALRLVAHGNWLRVLRQTWAAA